MRIITGLTKANIRNTGIELAPEYDFTDDGNRFRGFIYKGMPMSQCKCSGEVYLTIRVDYLDNEFDYKEWMNTKEYRLEDEFNGVSEFDMDKLIENLEKIIAKVNEMNAAAKSEELDMTSVKEALKTEIEYAESVVNEFKTNFKWYEARPYDLTSLAGYLKSEEREIAHAKDLLKNADTLEKKSQRHMLIGLKEYGYVEIAAHSFYLDQMKTALNK